MHINELCKLIALTNDRFSYGFFSAKVKKTLKIFTFVQTLLWAVARLNRLDSCVLQGLGVESKKI